MADKSTLDVAAIREAVETSPHDWVPQENALTRMSEDERKARLGVPLPDKETLNAIRAVARVVATGLRIASAAAVPAAFNLNNVDGVSYVAGVRNQGSCGSCVAFGSCAALEGTARYTRRLAGLDLDLSEAHLFYGWGASVGRNCQNGWFPNEALKFAVDRGVTYESEWPYVAGDTDHGTLPDGWESHRAKASGLVDLTGNVQGIKEHLNTYGPVAACFVVYDDFFALGANVYHHVTGNEAGGHCVAIVGYDDAQGAWIIKNSWGTSFGVDGFAMIGYGECYIESWQVFGVQGVSLRTWSGLTPVRGLYASNNQRNGWVYLDSQGWNKIGGATDESHHAMLAGLMAAKQAAGNVNLFLDDGVVTTAYTY